jgi:hypothetical protein
MQRKNRAMRRLQFEDDPRDPSYAGILAVAGVAAVAGYFWAGWVTSFLGFLLVGSLVLVMYEGHRNAPITADVAQAAELAMAAAKRKYPAEVPHTVEVCALKSDGYVFAILYVKRFFSLPTKRYFEVSRLDPEDVVEIDDPHQVDDRG